jgi:hypothetical protein
MKYLQRAKLDMALAEAGLITFPRNGYPWILRREKMKKLVCPRDPATGVRMFTEKQIKEIVKAFAVGGKGKWKP